MTSLNSINIHQVYLFDQNSTDLTDTNSLREFLNFLKYKTKKSVIDFCYSSETDSLHKHLSIQDNFILDAVPKSLIRDGEDNFKQFLRTLKNPYLKELILKLGDLRRPVESLNNENIKLTTVLKSLLAQSEYILLQAPEKYQSPQTLKLIKKSIQFEVYSRNRKVVIKASNRDIWLDISGHIIGRCKDSFRYHCSENPLLVTKTIIDFPSISKQAA